MPEVAARAHGGCRCRRAPAGRALIQDGKSHQIYSQVQTGGRMGMRTMAQSLANLVSEGTVRLADAERALSDPSELQNCLRAA